MWAAKLFLAFGCMCLWSSIALAQEPEPLQTLKLATRVVAIQAVVLDAQGEPVRGLSKEDFVLKQDGKPQEIRYFSQDATLPLTLALLVDTSQSQKIFLEDEIRASETFYRLMLKRPADRASLIQFDYDVLQRQGLTTALQTLENSLNFLSLPHPLPANAHGGTLLYEAVVSAARSFSAGGSGNERGRRAMVLLTDGEDVGSRATIEQAVAAAQRADVVIYAVLYSMAESGLGPKRPPAQHGRGHEFDPPSGREALTRLAAETGGQVFTVGPRMPLDLIYSQISDDLRLQYQIGYTPPEAKPGSFHKIELKPNGKHLTVEARQGFYTAN